jgi:hypothetical protein
LNKEVAKIMIPNANAEDFFWLCYHGQCALLFEYLNEVTVTLQGYEAAGVCMLVFFVVVVVAMFSIYKKTLAGANNPSHKEEMHEENRHMTRGVSNNTKNSEQGRRVRFAYGEAMDKHLGTNMCPNLLKKKADEASDKQNDEQDRMETILTASLCRQAHTEAKAAAAETCKGNVGTDKAPALKTDAQATVLTGIPSQEPLSAYPFMLPIGPVGIPPKKPPAAKPSEVPTGISPKKPPAAKPSEVPTGISPKKPPADIPAEKPPAAKPSEVPTGISPKKPPAAKPSEVPAGIPAEKRARISSSDSSNPRPIEPVSKLPLEHAIYRAALKQYRTVRDAKKAKKAAERAKEA